MKKIMALISAFFVMFSIPVSASYSGADLYADAERALEWIEETVSPLGGTDSVAADNYVIAMKRFGKVYDYSKYASITNKKVPVTLRDAQRIIMVNTASGGRLSDEFIANCTYNADLRTVSDIADAITAILSGEYKIKSDNTDIDRMAVRLLQCQSTDGGFESDIEATSKAVLALSFLQGNCYIVKGNEFGEEYIYDVNASILRAVNYLQMNKNEDFGFGSVTNTSYAVMALDAAGVDADNDPGFSDGVNSTLGSLMQSKNSDGSFGTHPDDTAMAACALVSHVRAMQGNSMFYALLTEDMPYDPRDYVEDFNYSGSGIESETTEQIEIQAETIDVSPSDAHKAYNTITAAPVKTETTAEAEKQHKVRAVAVIVIAIVFLTALVTWFVIYILNIKPNKKFHIKQPEDEDNTTS